MFLKFFNWWAYGLLPQVCVRVGGQEKCTAEARGKPNPEWEEALEFALSGNVVDSPDAHIEVTLFSLQNIVHGVARTLALARPVP